jgi:hypothetical protein
MDQQLRRAKQRQSQHRHNLRIQACLASITTSISMPVTTRRNPGTATAEEAELFNGEDFKEDSDDEEEPLATQKPDTYDESDSPMEEETAEEQVETIEETVEETEVTETEEIQTQAVEPEEAAFATKKQTVSTTKLVPLQFAKPMSFEALQNVQDMAEYWIDRILLEPELSKKHYINLKYFYGLNLEGSDVNFGRLHCRTLLAELMVIIYNEPLITWDRETWNEALFDELVSITRKLMRMDATTGFEYGKSMDEMEDGTLNPAQPIKKLKPRLRNVLTLIKLHAALAPIRSILETAMDQNVQPNISSNVLKDIL